MKTPVEIIKAARELISEPSRWTQGEYAVDKKGESEFPDSPTAACFCSVGAMYAAAGIDLGEGYLPEGVVEAFGLGPRETDIVHFNDEHSHREVLALFDEAIERASA